MTQDTRQKILVIIPAFNEEETIASVIADVRAHASGAGILVVNDGSSDSTAAIAERMGAVTLTHPYNLGIGATMQTGYKYARLKGFAVAVQVDADGQHRADQIEPLVKPILEGRAQITIGSRFLDGGGYKPSLARSAGMAVFSKVVSIILGVKVTDTTSGFRASGRDVINYFCYHYPDDYPEVEALVLLHRKGFRIIEVPVRMSERAGGHSSITPTRSVYYMIKVLLAIFVDLLKK
ncbi:MAG: glycosyltransferase family 2 protein [Deltaproteobacteria bacterium]|nr:glycosyltransferase family 2 protein [Deltaproteobacteria bacterium]